MHTENIKQFIQRMRIREREFTNIKGEIGNELFFNFGMAVRLEKAVVTAVEKELICKFALETIRGNIDKALAELAEITKTREAKGDPKPDISGDILAYSTPDREAWCYWQVECSECDEFTCLAKVNCRCCPCIEDERVNGKPVNIASGKVCEDFKVVEAKQ